MSSKFSASTLRHLPFFFKSGKHRRDRLGEVGWPSNGDGSGPFYALEAGLGRGGGITTEHGYGRALVRDVG
jgi:hypothetical protein